MQNNRKIGKEKEDLACKYLESNGYIILDKNFTRRIGEIDIIAKDLNDNTICFIEVKYRKDIEHGFAFQAVDNKKQKKIIATAKLYILYKKLSFNDKYRFDVISIDGENIILYKGAFNE